MDKNLLVLGHYAYACDYGANDCYFMKIDTNGTTVFQTSLTADNSTRYVNGVEQSDSSYYLIANVNSSAYGTVLYHYQNNGNYAGQMSLPFSPINAFVLLPNGNLLLNGKTNNTLVNAELSISGTIIQQQQTPNVITKFIVSSDGGKIYGKTNTGGLERFDSSLNSVATYTFSKVTDFTERNDSIFNTGNMVVTDNPFYEILDLNFSTLHQHAPNYKNVFPTAISLSNSGVNIIAKAASNVQTYMSFSELYQIPPGGLLSKANDIGVSDFTVTSYSLDSYGGYQYWNYLIDVTVNNYGTSPVTSFYLNHYARRPYGCTTLYHTLFNFTILPGNSLVVKSGQFPGQPMWTQSYYLSAGTPISENLCIFTSIPSGTGDIDITNDSKCISFTGGYNGITNQNQFSESVQVYPNPFTNMLNVESTTTIKNIVIKNALGQEIIKQQKLDTKSCNLNADIIKPGVYFVEIETQNGALTKKIIKN